MKGFDTCGLILSFPDQIHLGLSAHAAKVVSSTFISCIIHVRLPSWQQSPRARRVARHHAHAHPTIGSTWTHAWDDIWPLGMAPTRWDDFRKVYGHCRFSDAGVHAEDGVHEAHGQDGRASKEMESSGDMYGADWWWWSAEEEGVDGHLRSGS